MRRVWVALIAALVVAMPAPLPVSVSAQTDSGNVAPALVSFPKHPTQIRDIAFIANGARFVVATRGLIGDDTKELKQISPCLTLFDAKTDHQQLARYQIPANRL